MPVSIHTLGTSNIWVLVKEEKQSVAQDMETHYLVLVQPKGFTGSFRCKHLHLNM